MKICRENSNLVKIGQKYRYVYLNFVPGDIQSSQKRSLPMKYRSIKLLG